ncbi:hypothetical protein RQM47_08735 [Rubrivirga sp. S365]|uniref:Uncharacterized protein n=1 Tax=Rubrivirga litoralis TaxID=3075598 RepID=A0ABU3BTH9_9BACT|nr:MULTISPECIES: hypothetical protein [unclassified Rubrivirga]MDT0632587.1 hypothetical protein [Rubrivirga sp. F394]MDT7856723.1 hypothetical protein [Rubrivirga sp. S365]
MSRPPRSDDGRPAQGDDRPARDAGWGGNSRGGVVRDSAYWLSRPVAERLAEVERLRRERHGPEYGNLQMDTSHWVVWQDGRVVDGSDWRVRGDDPV